MSSHKTPDRLHVFQPSGSPDVVVQHHTANGNSNVPNGADGANDADADDEAVILYPIDSDGETDDAIDTESEFENSDAESDVENNNAPCTGTHAAPLRNADFNATTTVAGGRAASAAFAAAPTFVSQHSREHSLGTAAWPTPPAVRTSQQSELNIQTAAKPVPNATTTALDLAELTKALHASMNVLDGGMPVYASSVPVSGSTLLLPQFHALTSERALTDGLETLKQWRVTSVVAPCLLVSAAQIALKTAEQRVVQAARNVKEGIHETAHARFKTLMTDAVDAEEVATRNNTQAVLHASHQLAQTLLTYAKGVMFLQQSLDASVRQTKDVVAHRLESAATDLAGLRRRDIVRLTGVRTVWRDAATRFIAVLQSAHDRFAAGGVNNTPCVNAARLTTAALLGILNQKATESVADPDDVFNGFSDLYRVIEDAKKQLSTICSSTADKKDANVFRELFEKWEQVCVTLMEKCTQARAALQNDYDTVYVKRRFATLAGEEHAVELSARTQDRRARLLTDCIADITRLVQDFATTQSTARTAAQQRHEQVQASIQHAAEFYAGVGTIASAIPTSPDVDNGFAADIAAALGRFAVRYAELSSADDNLYNAYVQVFYAYVADMPLSTLTRDVQ